MSVIGEVRHFQHKRFFRVEIDGFGHSGFKSCTEIGATIAVINHFEGGTNVTLEEAGRVTYKPLTLDRGATKDRDMLTWFEQCANASRNGRGLVSPQYKRNGEIVQFDRDGETELKRWRIFNAWTSGFTGGQWENDGDELAMESIVLNYTGFKLVLNQ